jgi:hypothetical protein
MGVELHGRQYADAARARLLGGELQPCQRDLVSLEPDAPAAHPW